jgi:hypothetical protein
LLISAASAAVLGYVKNGPDLFLDSAGDPILDSHGDPIGIPDDMRFATLLLIGEFYKNREAKQDGEIDPAHGYGYLPRVVTALLYRYRTPSLS